MITLYLIPVPIADNALHTLPAYTIETAKRLDLFIVEKAKTARHFIKSLGPAKPIQEMVFVEIPERNEKDKTQENEAETLLLEAKRTGRDIGLLSEAGCPGVADPGATIVALAHREGIKVVPLVGPSSLLLAIMASGMNGQQFAFNGYLSAKRPELAVDLRRLEQLSQRNNQTQLFIETPYRSQMVLDTALETLQPDTYFSVAQDLTGAGEITRTLRIREWKKAGKTELEKLPAVFLLYRR